MNLILPYFFYQRYAQKKEEEKKRYKHQREKNIIGSLYRYRIVSIMTDSNLISRMAFDELLIFRSKKNSMIFNQK